MGKGREEKDKKGGTGKGKEKGKEKGREGKH